VRAVTQRSDRGRHRTVGLLVVVELEGHRDLRLVLPALDRRHLDAEFVDFDPADVVESCFRAVDRVVGRAVETRPMSVTFLKTICEC